MAIVVLGLCSRKLADFAQWDNLEIYLPWILSGHRRLMHGDFPLWNPFQNLGEPLHAMGPGGILYLPYTLCVALVDAVGWNPRAVMNVIAVTHIGLAGLGLHRLCRAFGVRPAFAMIAAISGAMSGFALIVGGVWIHVLPTLAWNAWALWAVKELVDDHRPVRAALVATLSLAMAFAVGHVQAAAYLWLDTALFATAYAASRRMLRARFPVLAAVAVAAALLAMPQVLPSAALLPDSNRTQAMTRQEFGFRGVSVTALLGLLLPSYGGMDGFLEVGSLSSTHSGAWLVPALIGGVGVWFFARRTRRAKPTARDPDDRSLRNGLVLSLGLSLLVIVMSLGGSAPFYGWTYGVPVWSSFRWPFKLFQHALPTLMVAGGISLELLMRHPGHAVRRVVFAAVAVLALLIWVSRPGLGTPGCIATGIFGLMAMVSLVWLDTPWGRTALTVAVVLEAGGMMFLTHRMDRPKTYAHEQVGNTTVKQLGISTDYRLLPLSPAIPEDAAMEELGLFHSATLDGYYSLTGHRMALTSQRLWNWLPTNALGLLPRQLVPLMLQSHLIRSYNTRYVLAAKNDTAMVGLVRRMPGYRPVAETPTAVVFANDDALPRVWFATEVRPFTVSAARAGMIQNRTALTSALVSEASPRGPLPPARAERWAWGQDRVAVDVAAPQGGFLVLAMNYSPDWRANVDGRPARLWLTNGAISGLEVPAGARHVVLDYVPHSFRTGLWLALLGFGVLGATVFVLSRRAAATEAA